MTLNQLEYFMTAAQYGSMTKAANKLFVTHSTISRSISDLEKELGVSLFVRENHSLTLTESGKLLLEQCEKLFDDLANLRAKMEQQRLDLSNNLQISLISQTASPQIYSAFRKFRDDFPNASLNIEEIDSNYLEEKLLNDELDMVITYSFVIERFHLPAGRYASSNLFRENICAVVNVDSPEAAMDSLDPYRHKMKAPLRMENADAPFLDDVLPMTLFLEHTNQRHKEPRSLNSVILSIVNGHNWACLPECMAYSFASRCKILPIVGADTSHYLTMLWRTDSENALLNDLASYIVEEYKGVDQFMPIPS